MSEMVERLNSLLAEAQGRVKHDCPKCKGSGFYLAREERFYRDGSYAGNEWEDCMDCDSDEARRKIADLQLRIRQSAALNESPQR